MRTQLIRNVSVALFAAASVFAQGSHTLIVQVPFDFHVGSSILPAGDYNVYADAGSLMRVRSTDAKSSVMIQTSGGMSRAASNDNKLIFKRYGEEYFLSEVWTGSSGRALPKTKREIEVAASARRGPQVVLAAK